MSVEIYCGEPPANIVLWIRDNALPAGNPKTLITFTDSSSTEYDWSGEINQQTMVAAGLYNDNTFEWIKYPLTVKIGTNVTSIGEAAFDVCSSLTSITIPDSVTSIGNLAFSYCSSLTSVTIPNGVTSIGALAFTYSGITNMTIPNLVTSIGEWAFNGCTSLTSVVFKGKTLEQVKNIEDSNGDKYYPWGIDESKISVEP